MIRQSAIPPLAPHPGAGWWRGGRYVPLSAKEAFSRAAKLILFFEANGMNVIRCGLHPSSGLMTGGSCLAGPFDVSFRQKCENRIFRDVIDRISENEKISEIRYSPEDEPALFHSRKKESHADVKLVRDDSEERGCLKITAKSGKLFDLTRKNIAELLIPGLLR